MAYSFGLSECNRVNYSAENSQCKLSDFSLKYQRQMYICIGGWRRGRGGQIADTAVTDAASEILGNERCRKKPWVIGDVLDLCEGRRDLKKKRYEAEGAKEYREENKRIQKAMKKAKEDWIGAQWEEIETCLNKNNSKRAYQLVKDLTSEKQGRSSTIQGRSGKYLTDEQEILRRWTE